MENATVLQFKPGLHKSPIFEALQNELKEINKHTKVKLRTKTLNSGKRSFYLEVFKNKERERYFLELYYLGGNNTKKKDKENLRLAISMLHKKDEEYRTNKHNFTFVNKRKETGFIEYFESIVNKRARPDKSGIIH